ncbi:MAG: HPF/RaiA family ribosome-associated protein [Patescibacteria group bacterium]
MQIHFKGTNYEIPPEISAHARKKFESLHKYLGKGELQSYAYVDLGRETSAHANGRIWYADINLHVDGTRFYAKAVEETLENAIDTTVRELASELHTARKKKIKLARKGGGMFKSLMQRLST